MKTNTLYFNKKYCNYVLGGLLFCTKELFPFPLLSSPTSLPYELVNEFLPQTLKPYSSQSKSQTIPKRARQHRTSEILQAARLGGKLLSLPHTDGHTQKAYGGENRTIPERGLHPNYIAGKCSPATGQLNHLQPDQIKDDT